MSAMNIKSFDVNERAEVISLFKRVFADSEGEQEGNALAALVTELIDTTDASDLYGFVAKQDSKNNENSKCVATIFFSRLITENDHAAFLLSPVAVDTSQQGKGLGQALIHHGLDSLKSLGVEFVVTYGDPAFYSKVGFESLSESIIPAPFKLSMSQGWLINNLREQEVEALASPVQCVQAFNNPHLW